jgi:hypothetical protein
MDDYSYSRSHSRLNSDPNPLLNTSVRTRAYSTYEGVLIISYIYIYIIVYDYIYIIVYDNGLHDFENIIIICRFRGLSNYDLRIRHHRTNIRIYLCKFFQPRSSIQSYTHFKCQVSKYCRGKRWCMYFYIFIFFCNKI